MAKLVKETIRLLVMAGIALTISGLVGSASGQALAGASAQVFKSDINRNGFGEGQTLLAILTADSNRNFSDKVPVSLADNAKIETDAKGSTNPSEIAANVTVEAPTRANVALLSTVMPSGTQPTGTDLVFTISFTNSGGQAAQVLTVIEPIPGETDFKLDSPSTALGTTGLTAVVEFSNDNASTWTYAPVSGGGGAADGYDRLVTHVRWRFNGSLSQSFPDNAGSVNVTARIQ